ncbi:MAG: nitrogenase molybdenum-iron protein [Lachnospiraceae bacterium]|nr:nitrogenase molybdenum-iron protein [Lachnospiraceae bacterium]
MTVKGCRRVLTPFAPDQSGAVAALYGLGGINVIVDAGGCTGNICGFDEPRWLTEKAAVFSAGLRDMDAILGRDDKLIEKLTDAADRVGGSFAALIGTPVPAVIGTDFRALKRMVEKKVSLPVLTVESTGMQWYDKGAEAAYRELFITLAGNNVVRSKEGDGTVNVIGTIPMDMPERLAESLRKALKERGFERIRLFGMGASLEDVKRAEDAALTIAVSPAAIQAAGDLEKRFGIPVEIGVPGAESLLPDQNLTGKRILIIHQAVLADSLRKKALERGAASAVCATWFMMPGECVREGDVPLKEEGDLTDLIRTGSFDMILGDAVYRPLGGSFTGIWHDLPHFAVSGRWE